MIFFIVIILSSSIVLFSSCSTIQAVYGESMKDLYVLKTGNDRHTVLAELKTPIFSEIKGDNRIKIKGTLPFFEKRVASLLFLLFTIM